MDWDSPTTKKLIKEAEAQGCKLIGAGKSIYYRLYALPCGHAQEAQTGAMRIGNFRCSVCLAEKLNQEAEARGCKLVGAGRNAHYRKYALPCGHEQEVDCGAMRAGNFRCSVCFAIKLEEEAQVQGCKLLGPGKNRHYRLYSLSCGHEQEVGLDKIRDGIFRCSVCLAEKLNQEAEARGCKLVGAGRNANYRKYALPCGHEQEVGCSAIRGGNFRCSVCFADKLNQAAQVQGCKLLGPGKNKSYRLYSLSCGHEQEVGLDKIRDGIFRCSVCLAEKLNQEAEARGCKLVGAGRNANYRKYALPCGHEQEVNVARMRDGGFRCSICLANKLNQEAQVQGCKLLGPGKNKSYRLYSLSCGHEREVDIGQMRDGYFRCQICEETSRTLPSNVYLFHIKVDSDEWLKLGYAKEVDSRASKYGLPKGAEVTTVCCLPFDTGNEAHAAEADIHKRHRRKRLTSNQMIDFHTKGGFEECYPVTMLETLLAELRALKSPQAS